jgi:alkyldihydroxyacetonephosphate synthase
MSQSSRRPVTDLWPLRLMRQRADEGPPEVPVVRPTSAEQVADLLRSHRPVVAMGGASGVCGALGPGPRDLVMDMAAFSSIEVDEANLTVRAGAGVNGMELEQELNRRGLTLGHYPSSLPDATVGGLISTRSSGQESTRYGHVEDMLLGVTVALADGRVVEARPHPRTAAGPPLHLLFVGAEGGLGVVLEAELKVHRLPEAVLGRGWRLRSVEAGLEAMREVAQRELRPLVLRLYDPEDSAFQSLEGWSGGCLLVAATAGPRLVAEAEAVELGALVAAAGGEDLGADAWRHWHEHRFDLSARRLREVLAPPGSIVDTMDLGCRWTALARLHREVKARLAEHGVVLCHFAHATAQGACAYFTFAAWAADEAAAQAAYRRVWETTMSTALELGATISHHHGVGQLRAPWVRADLGGWWHVWEVVRSALDPERRLNPNALGGEVG